MTQMNHTRSISIEDWCAMSAGGAAPPVTVPLKGDSMRPLIRREVDPVTIVPLRRPLKRGDVVLFTTGAGRYVVHRVWKIDGDRVRTLGDNCVNPDPWIPADQVLGQAISYRRGKARHSLDTVCARLWGRVWMAVYPVRKSSLKLKALLGRGLRMCTRHRR